jgi:predicted Zn-dependent protease
MARDDVWVGLVFDSGLPKGQSECTLSVRGRRLVARLPSGDTLDVDLTRMEQQPSGQDGHAFASTSRGGVTITTRDPRVVAAVERARAGRPTRRGLTLAQTLVLGGALAAVLVAALAALLVGPLARVAVAAIPRSVDRDLGREALNGAMTPLRASDRPPAAAVSAVVAAVMERLLGALGRPELSFEVTVVDSKVVNAFALPDGHVLVTTALLALMSSADELAAVLAHEVNHVACRHVVELMIRQSGLKVILMGVTGGGENVGRNLLASSAGVAALSFNRQMESEADQRGLDLLSRALIDPRAAVRVMERLAAQEGDGGPPEYLRTHPVTGKRIEAMEAWIARHPPQGAFAVEGDWAALERALRLSRGR